MIYLPFGNRRLLFGLIILFSLLFSSNIAKAQEKTGKDSIIVRYRKHTSISDRLLLRKSVRGYLIGTIERLHADVIKVSDVNIPRVLERLRKDKRIEYAEPDYIASVQYMPNDPYLSNQWALFTIDAAGEGISAWDLARRKRRIRVAILDTGIDTTHPDLSGQVIETRNFTNSPTTDDLYGHGTHVAGIVAAIADNNQGIAGLSNQSKLVNTKVLNDRGYGYYSWIVNAIIWAADEHIPVVNMSLGGPNRSRLLQDAVRYAWNKGTLLVAAAGNTGQISPIYPAYLNEVIAVAATDKNDEKASFSNYGPWVEVAAPGVSILSTLSTSSYKLGRSLSYGYASGTSMAAPHVSGLAALLFGFDNMTNTRVRNILGSTADRISGSGYYWSKGRINAYNALSTLIRIPTQIPTPLPTATPSPTHSSTLTPMPVQPSFTPTPTNPWWCSRLFRNIHRCRH